MGLWTSRLGLSVSVCIFGFFSGAMGPTYAELLFMIAGPHYFNFAYGFANPAMGMGWFFAPPAGGIQFLYIECVLGCNSLIDKYSTVSSSL